MANSFSIRAATMADKSDVVVLFHDYYEDGHEHLNTNSLDTWTDRCLKQTETKMFLGITDGRAVAFARTNIKPDNTGFICDLYTDPAYEGRGIGTALIIVT
jgi:ribosomal protein S18 acetylase RimI-like enzyme